MKWINVPNLKILISIGLKDGPEQPFLMKIHEKSHSRDICLIYSGL